MIAVTAVAVVWAAPAWGAFPGRDGDLVVATGSGLDAVNPSTGASIAICTSVQLCGDPEQPRVSPNGQAIAFIDSSTSRLVVIAPDGSCLWCLLGPPLTSVTGREPAFTAGGRAVTLAANGLKQISLTGAATHAEVKGPVDDAVWSSRGVLAIVRGGWVWVGHSGHVKLRRLARGQSPSFSPNGSKLAFVRRGQIWIVAIGGGHQRRLARGTSPAWSPNGGQIAFIGSGGAVEIAGAHGGRAHRVGTVSGSSLDWQPLPASADRACAPPKGSTVLASSGQAVVYATHGEYGAYSADECLRALGIRHTLFSQGPYSEGGTTVTGAALGGRFAVVSTSLGGKGFCCALGVTLEDLASGASTPLFKADSASYGGPSVQTTIGPLALDSSGFSAWRVSQPIPLFEPLNAVSCASLSLCVAVDQAGRVASSSDPVGGRSAWSLANVAGAPPLTSVSCPSTSLCVATSSSSGLVLTSTDPTGGPSAWTTTLADPKALGSVVSCPSASLCVLGDAMGNVVVSADPTGGASTWSLAHVESGIPIGFGGMTCPSTSLCVGTSNSGDVVTSTDPTGGASAWTISHIDATSFPEPTDACASTSLCVVVDRNGNVFTSTDPTGGASAWSEAHLDSLAIAAVSCPSASLCVAVDQSGDVITSTNPTGGAPAWQIANVDGSTPLTAISCPSATRCVATDGKGNVLTSGDPTGGATAWTSAPVDVPDCAVEKTPCAVERLYARDDRGTRVIDSTPPGAGTSLANISLSGDGLVLSWTHDGVPEQARLG